MARVTYGGKSRGMPCAGVTAKGTQCRTGAHFTRDGLWFCTAHVVIYDREKGQVSVMRPAEPTTQESQ